MAEKRLNKDKIAPIDVLDNIGDSATRNKKKVDALESSLKVLKNTAKTIKGGLAGATTGDTKSLAELNELTKRANTTAKTKLGIDKELLIEKEKLRAANAEQNRNIKEELALAKTQKGSLARIRLESKKLRNEKEKLNLTTKKGQQRLKMINMTLDRNNKILEKNATKLGKQKIAIGKYSKALGGLRRVLGQVGIAFGAMALVRDSFNIIKDFQQAQANLASVLGVNVKEMKALTDQAKELGATTRFTASQVSELQVELAKLGFTQQQIQDMTPATLALAEATGTELAEAAAVAGSTLNAFGLEATDTQRVVDTMAKAFSTSSLDMSKFSTAMASVAPIAKTMGFSIEETTAMLGELTDSGLDASTAGTSLKNMMLAAKANGLTWKEALDKVKNSQDKATTSLELFGKRGVAAGVILADNQEAVAAQTKTLDENTEASLRGESAAAKMAETQRNTLGGSLDLLRSAWEGLVLSMDEAGGVGETLRDGLRFLADNLGTIVKIIGKVIKAFILYKTVLAALKLRDKIKDQIAFNKSLRQSGTDATKATKGVKAFGGALKSIGIGAMIFLVTELATAWLKVASGAQQATLWANKYKAAQEAGSRQAQERLDRINNTLKKRVEALQLAAVEAKKLGGTAADFAKIDKDTQKQIEALTRAKEKQLTLDVERTKVNKIAAQAAVTAAIKERDAFLEAAGGRNAILSGNVLGTLKSDLESALTLGLSEALEGDAENFQETLVRLDAAVVTSGGNLSKQTAIIAVYRNGLRETSDEVIGFNIAVGDSLEPIEETTGALEKQTKAYNDLTNAINKQFDAEQELFDLKLEFDLEDIQARLEDEKKFTEETGIVRKEMVDFLLAEEERLAKAQIERLFLLEMETANSAEEIELAEQRRIFALIRLEDEMAEKRKATLIEVDELQEEFADKNQPRSDEEIKVEEDKQKKLKDLIEKFGQEVLDGMINRSKEKQSILDEEIDKQQELADALRQGAMEVNAIATESLAALESSIEAKERAKMEEAEREENLERAKAAWNALNNFMDQGDSFPVASLKSISAVSVFESIVGKIKGFFTGTTGRLGDEDTAVRSGKDGHLIWADSDEMIFNGGQVDQAEASGMNTTDDIIKSAVMFHQLKGINAENHVHNLTVDNSEVVNEIKSLKNIIKNKKEITFSKNIQQGLADGIVRTEKQGSMTNRFIIHGK